MSGPRKSKSGEGIAWKGWGLALLILVAASVAAWVALTRWLGRSPFVQHDESGLELVDAGVELVSRAELVRVARDAGLPTDASVDASVDAGLSLISGPAPGATWAGRTRNYLIVGVDRKPWGRGGGLADTLIVAALDMRSGHVGLVSIPRDYYVEFREGQFGRINTAFQFAAENGMSREAYIAKVVGELLDIPIRDTIIVDLTVLERSVDAVGGVEVRVPCPIRDNFIDPRTATGRRLLDVPAGDVHMDGVTAAMYARSRHGRSDWDRARRQQAVLLALRRRVATVDALPLVPALLDELEAHLSTELSRREILELARFGMRIDAANMHGMVLASAASQHFRTPEGSQVLLPDIPAVRAQIVNLFDAPAPGVETRAVRCVDVDAALAGRVAQPGTPDAAMPVAPRDAGLAP